MRITDETIKAERERHPELNELQLSRRINDRRAITSRRTLQATNWLK